jgi:tetratricopeptide (TPR) repeat protein
MDKKDPRKAAARAAKAATASVGTYWIAATAAIVLVLVGVVTAIVTTKPTPALIGALILLAALSAVLAVMQQHSTQSPPATAPASDPAVFDPSAENPYGAPFFTRHAFRLSTFPYPASGLLPVPRAESGDLVNRDGERELLDRTLRADRSDVIVVHGPPGAGKSTLVSRALRDAGLSETMVRRYNYPGDRFDAKTLCEDLDTNTRSGTGPRPGEDVLTRLQAAVEPPDDTPAFIVVDGAQYLLDPDTHAFISLELAEAIGVIARGWRRVKLILLFQERPVPKAGSEWLESADAIGVKGLAREHWEECLQQLDPGGKFGLATLTPAERDGLHDALRGIPRLAELFRTVLELPRNHWNAAGLARHLANQPSGAAERLLAGELVDSLSDEQRQVIVGLAAYGTPVTSAQLKDLLEEELSPGRVPALLAELTGLHVISMTSDRYYVPTSEIQDALMRLPDPDGPAHLWSRATDLLSRSRKEQVQQPEELDVYFAELDILIRRQLWGSCYELIDTMEKQLQRWNAAALLLRYRETIAGKLQRSFQEMVNYNALGCIYLSLGKLGKAQQAFENALRNADAAADRYPHGRRKIYINLGALGLESGETARAEQHYRDALAMAGEHDDVLDRMAAMAGLADCFRRHGDYDEAIRYAKLALSAAQGKSSPWAADIAVKLARWHSELDRREEAFQLIDVADQEAAEHPEDPALRVRCLDGRADLLLDAGDCDQARDVAQDALTRALELNGPVTVLQARTTMAMACLRLDQMDVAIREIDRAAPYRRAGRSLVVLALQALIAFRADPNAEDARKLFAQLEREAVQRRERDVRDFAAWDFEGLASCGIGVGRIGSLDPAIAAFRHAREQAAPPGLIARMRFWLGILQAKALPGQMDPVLAAAVGTAARPERP